MNRVALVLAMVATACARAPTKPASVPESAEWAVAGGSGEWVDCNLNFKEPTAVFSCRVYSETGVLKRAGLYALVEETPTGMRCLSGPFHRITPRAVDGDIVRLTGERALVPMEWVDRSENDYRQWRVRPNNEMQLTRPAQATKPRS